MKRKFWIKDIRFLKHIHTYIHLTQNKKTSINQSINHMTNQSEEIERRCCQAKKSVNINPRTYIKGTGGIASHAHFEE